MFLNSLRLSGAETFGRAIWCSIFQDLGYSALCVILLKIIWAGTAIVLEQNLMIFLGRSPGTIPLGFFALKILAFTSVIDSMGAND